jgi:pimeloyl-ACP methyl ester carboxylesterase
MFHCIVLALTLIATVRSAEICCPDIGCFTDDIPFDGIALPMCVADMNPHYLMFTLNNPGTGELFDHLTVPTQFVGSRRTIFLVHGWNSNGESAWLHSMKDALLAKEDANVVIVDWGGGAELANYFQAASNTRTMGAYTALVTDNLITNGASYVWLMGHSLGGHLVGHAGMRSANSLNRVTGLDPAGPWFQGNEDKTVGINPTSGSLVDIIHTDTQLGALRDVGHIDFYPAGGAEQPGCAAANKEDVATPHDSCSHSRAYEYMEISISQDCFLSRSVCTNVDDIPNSCTDCTCDTNPCAKMGYYLEESCQLSGWYYVGVTSASPFCVGRH